VIAAGDESPFELDDRVVDIDQHEDQRSAGRVVDIPGATADEQRVQGTGKTVADFNPDHPPDAPVVGIQFERARGEIGGQTYHYPTTRLEPIDEDWEPTEAASKGQRERQQIIDTHTRDVERFADLARRLLDAPAETADLLFDRLRIDDELKRPYRNMPTYIASIAAAGYQHASLEPDVPPPKRRGECQYVRDDRYRPDNDDAIVCWECSDRLNNRPRKFERDDPAGECCTRYRRVDYQAAREEIQQGVRLRSFGEDEIEPLVGYYDGTIESGSNGYQLLRDISGLRGDEDDTRRTAIRVAYNVHLQHVEEYNYSRAVALLRDIGRFDEMPILGTGGGE
jgi:hypothetical protein